MNIKSLTQEQFLSHYTINPTDDDVFWKLPPLAPFWTPGTERPLPTRPGYAMAPLTTIEPLGHDMILLHRQADGSYEAVGAYFGDLLAVRADHQRKGLATELILATAPHRPIPATRTVSPAGLAALKKAWRVAQHR